MSRAKLQNLVWSHHVGGPPYSPPIIGGQKIASTFGTYFGYLRQLII